MSVLGIGIDLVELRAHRAAAARHGERAVARICREASADARRSTLVQHLGGLFAAKEAVLKALGTGWAQGPAFRHVEIVRGDRAARPTVRLHDVRAARAARAWASRRIHLSITHDRGYAAAVAVLEAWR